VSSEGDSAARVVWCAYPEVTAGDNGIEYGDPGASIFTGAPADLVALLVGMLNAGATETALEDAVIAQGDTLLLAQWLDAFHLLCRSGRAAPSVSTPQGLVVRLRAVRVPPSLPQAAELPASVRLSRFAMASGATGTLVVESPLSAYSAQPGPALAALLPALATGMPTADISDPGARTAIALLLDTHLVVDGDGPDEDSGALRMWEPHDLWFHWRTRRGGHNHVIGATFPHRPTVDPIPTIAERDTTQVVALARPEASEGPGIWSLLSGRQSRRNGSAPLDAATLGEFLWWHRIVRDVPMDEANGVEYHQSRRPYPGGGAMYEIDLVLTMRDVAGVPAGVWRYDPRAHTLNAVAHEPNAIDLLFADALVSTGGNGAPQVLITYCVRIARNSWKYEGMAYRAALLNAGVLYEHAYLVAEALGMAACGLGNADRPLFSRLVDLPHFEFEPVAEVMLAGMR
jgi:SagB-type dehydrogenase family enzyme